MIDELLEDGITVGWGVDSYIVMQIDDRLWIYFEYDVNDERFEN